MGGDLYETKLTLQKPLIIMAKWTIHKISAKQLTAINIIKHFAINMLLWKWQKVTWWSETRNIFAPVQTYFVQIC